MKKVIFLLFIPWLSLWAQINNGGGSSSSSASTISPFISYSGNPVIAPVGGENQIFLASMVKVGSSFVCYYSYQVSNVTVTGRCTSPDGKTITKDSVHNPVFNVGANGTWDAHAIWTPLVWTEDGGNTFNMLYTAQDASNVSRIGLATSTDGITFTRWPGNNCTSTTGNGCVIDIGIASGDNKNIELSGIIKVGSTYYLPLSEFSASATRTTGNATSTDLHTWTKDAANPTFSGTGCPTSCGYYDASIWKVGTNYYMAIGHEVASGLNSELELYQDTAPTFYPSSRTFIGVLKKDGGFDGTINAATTGAQWDSYVVDESWVYADDVTRTTFTGSNGAIWIYTSSTSDSAHQNFSSGLLMSPLSPPWPNSQTQFGIFPYGINASSMCVGCLSTPANFRGIHLGPSFGGTPYQFFSNSAKTSGTARPQFVSSTPLEFYGIGPADTSASNAVVKLGVVTGADADWSATSDTMWMAQGYTVPLTATAALTAGQVVKADSANASAVVVAVTTDTGGGIPLGIVQNSPGAAGTADVVLKGIVTTPLLGTGTCSIGNFVIVDTTTNGRVKCTGTYTAGTVIGTALTAQASVGSAVTVLVAPR